MLRLRFSSRVVPLVSSVLVACGQGPVPLSTAAGGVGGTSAAEGETRLLVRWRDQEGMRASSGLLGVTGWSRAARQSPELLAEGWVAVEGPAATAGTLRRSLAARSGVAAVSGVGRVMSWPTERVVQPSLVGPFADPGVRQQYHHRLLRLAEAHAVTRGRPEVVVAVVDTGADLSHPDFLARGGGSRVVAGRNHLDGGTDLTDGTGHGTHCLGVVGATAGNGQGVEGVAPETGLRAERVLDARGQGTWESVAAGILAASRAGARVISLSLGDSYSAPVLEQAVAAAQARGALLVAAMGNYGDTRRVYPASLPGVLAVGATNQQDQRAGFSSQGAWIGVSAPGMQIYSTLPHTGRYAYGYMSGTSMAAPMVSGLAALLWARHPEWKAEQVARRIRDTAIDLGPDGFDIQFGHGRIDPLAALKD
ncbi:MAG: S8 family serine peptidase [Candidatus Sericytochromatia bacterium]|nr:S8 family serine peptidase [Candidatus Sericytochromatia bacterium]